MSEKMAGVAEKEPSLWMLIASPIFWAAHFLLCYITASVWYAKIVGLGGPLASVRVAIAVYTALALAGIAIVGRIGYRKPGYRNAARPHGDDTPEDRQRFLRFVTRLLSALCAVAVIYAGLVTLFFSSCY